MHIFFLIAFLYNANITSATIQTLPTEIIKKILDFDLNDYHLRISIANTLNKNNFFQDSPCQIVAHLFQKPKPNLMLTCKQFNDYIKRDIKNEIPLKHELYINFLIENQSIFNFNKKTVLENLALLLFNVYDEKINEPYNNKLEFYEPLAFSLTFQKKYIPDVCFNDLRKIPPYKLFFENVSWFNNNLTLYISEPEKLFLIGYLSNILTIRFHDDNKPIFKKFLKTNGVQEKFLKIIQKCIEKKSHTSIIKTLFNSAIKIKSTKKIMEIIEFLVSNDIYLNNFQYEDYINHKDDHHKNCMRIINFFSIYEKNCQYCLYHKKKLWKIIIKNAFRPKDSFLGRIIQFLIYKNNSCNHTTFENQKIKNWIQKTFPKNDYEKFLKITLLMQQNKQIIINDKWFYSYLLDQNTNIFKNFVNIADFCQEKNHLIKLCTFIENNTQAWDSNYTLQYFNKDVLSKIPCYCFDCNKRWLIYNLNIIIIFLIGGTIIARSYYSSYYRLNNSIKRLFFTHNFN